MEPERPVEFVHVDRQAYLCSEKRKMRYRIQRITSAIFAMVIMAITAGATPPPTGHEAKTDILKGPRVQITSPSKNTVFTLTESQFTQTPKITYSADVLDKDGNPIAGKSIAWTYKREYAAGIHDLSGNGSMTGTTTGASEQTIFQAGGKITLTATAIVDGATISSSVTIFVNGESGIPAQTIVNRLVALYNGVTPRLLVGIMRIETLDHDQQFYGDITKYGIKGGWPAEGGLGGHIGLMMVPPTLATAWNWLENTKAGADAFAEKLGFTDSYVAGLRKKYKKLPDLTGVQRENDALSLYRGKGHYYKPNQTKDDWEQIPGAAATYVDKVRAKAAEQP
jgi:hypothetical protein